MICFDYLKKYFYRKHLRQYKEGQAIERRLLWCDSRWSYALSKSRCQGAWHAHLIFMSSISPPDVLFLLLYTCLAVDRSEANTLSIVEIFKRKESDSQVRAVIPAFKPPPSPYEDNDSESLHQNVPSLPRQLEIDSGPKSFPCTKREERFAKKRFPEKKRSSFLSSSCSFY